VKKAPAKKQTCIYCGKRPAVKNEHVIAESFFITGDSDKLPAVMVTVPSCKECDSGRGDGGPRDFHLDEEYVRNALVSRVGMENHPIANKLMPKAARAFGRSVGLAVTMFGTAKELTILRKQKGILVPTPVVKVDVDMKRFHRVFKKIVRGLHYANYKKPVAPDANIQVWVDLDRDAVHKVMATLTGPWYGWTNGVFMYKYSHLKGRQDVSLWLMLFYDRFAAMATVNVPDDLQ
jgi:hypothetical protein